MRRIRVCAGLGLVLSSMVLIGAAPAASATVEHTATSHVLASTTEAAGAETHRAPLDVKDGNWHWASGSIRTNKSDKGDLDSYVYYYVRYRFVTTTTLNISHVLFTNPAATYAHYVNHICYQGCGSHGKHNYPPAYIPGDTYYARQIGWTDRAGGVVKVWVTNSSWDSSGTYGETWTGQVTLPG